MSDIDDAINDILLRSETVITELEDFANTVNNIPVPDTSIPTAIFGTGSNLNLGIQSDSVLTIVTDTTTPYINNPNQVTFSGSAGGGGVISQRKARGSQANTEAVEDGDITGGLYCWGHDGEDFQPASAIRFKVDGVANSAAANEVPMKIVLETNDDIGSIQERLVVRPTGEVEIGGEPDENSSYTDGTSPLGVPSLNTREHLRIWSQTGDSILTLEDSNLNTATLLKTANNNELRIMLNDSDAVIVDANANIQIANGLDVTGSTGLTVGVLQGSPVGTVGVKTADDGYAISLEENSGNETYQIGINSSGDFLLYNSKNSDPTFIVDDGNRVGINVDPGVDLDIADDSLSSTCYARVRSSNESGYIWHNGTSNLFGLYWDVSKDYLQFYDEVASAERGHIKSDGTFVWDKSLTVNSNNGITIGASNGLSTWRFWSGTAGDADIDALLPGSTFGSIIETSPNGHCVIGIRENDPNDGFYIISGGGDYQSNNQVYDKMNFAVKSDGNVGIGTTNPTSRLHIFDDNSDLEMDNLAQGQFHIDGNGYGFGIALNADGAQIYNNSASRGLIFGTNEIERMRISGAGDVGIGTDNPLNKFVVSEGTNQHGIELAPGTTSYIQAYDRATADYGDLKIDAQIIQFGTDNGAERMRIDATGNLLVSKSSSSFGTGTAGVELLSNGRGLFEASGDTVLAINRQDGTSSANIIQFYRGNSLAGTIQAASGSAPTFAANSDTRLKENVVDHESEIDNIMALRPTRWNWKDSDLGIGEGFIAQELEQTAWSDLVSEGKDGYKQVAGLGAVETRLIKAIQEQQAMIADLNLEIEKLRLYLKIY